MARLQTLERPHPPLIMGILNVTPDSFSDGGTSASLDEAVAKGLSLADEGADIIDVGGESTRPGSERVAVTEQLARVIPVIKTLRQALPATVLISVDTTRVDVAEAALEAGADFINDISAGQDDARMLSLAARRQVPIVLMHMQGTPKTMQDDPRYDDVVSEVLRFLLERAQAAEVAGLAREQIILDPGIGFGKRRDDNLALLRGLQELTATGYSVMLGASRKRFMGAVCRESRPNQLVAATVATTALGIMAGVDIFRVHDVRENRQAADVTWAIINARG